MTSLTRRSAVLLPLAVLLSPCLPARAGARAPSVSWAAVRDVTEIVAAARLSPPRAARLLAHACVAGAEAAAVLHPDGDAAAALAVRLAAHAVQDGVLVPPPGPGAPRVEQVATAAAAAVARRAAADGAGAPAPTVERPSTSGHWQPLPGQEPLDPGAGTWLSWRPLPPVPALPVPAGSAAETQAYEQVLAVSRALTPEQRALAEHWADGPGTVTPAGRWVLLALQALAEDPRPLALRLQVLASMATAASDAFTTCWRLKYREWTERPVTRIRRELDPGWEPLLPTPPFPGWVSGHATVSAACAEVLAADRPEQAAHWRDLAAQAAASRLYGGIHVPHDNTDGAAVGVAVGKLATAHRRASPGRP